VGLRKLNENRRHHARDRRRQLCWCVICSQDSQAGAAPEQTFFAGMTDVDEQDVGIILADDRRQSG